jgi:hypothetical protein
MDTQTGREELDRLVEIELDEIPQLRTMLSGWPDDLYLAARLQALRAEASRLRVSIGLD